MHLLHVVGTVHPAYGGPVECIKQLYFGLTSLGHTMEVVCVDAPNAPWIAESPFRVHAVGPGCLKYGYTSRLVPWLRAYAHCYDIVVVHGIWQYHSLATRRALHKRRQDYFIYPHGALDPWFKRAYPFKHLKKALYWPWADYRVLKDARGVIFTCEEERVRARQSFRLYKANEMTAPLGISRPPGNPAAQRNAFLARYPHLQHKRILLYLSRIHAKKGCDLLIEAFTKVAQRHAALHLVMAGPCFDGLVNQLQAQAAKHGMGDRITWAGMLMDDLKWGAFHAAEAFALISHQENFGIAVVESMAAGLPVLISNKVNIWREIEADGAGLTADDDLSGATGLLERWLAMPREEKQAMRANARRCFEQRFEIGKAADNLIDLLCLK